MRGLKTAVALTMLIAAVAVVGACGKRGELEMPDGRKAEYPRTYPAP